MIQMRLRNITGYALTVYDHHTKQSYQNYFKYFFDALDGVSDEAIDTVARAISILSENMVKSRQDPLFFEPGQHEQEP